jgi:uncharacterized protein YlzI (FlbEa/FlbD family)
MTKAKELAKQLKKHLDVYTAEIQSDYSEALIYSLINAVLSEPEPVLKEWIEVDEQGLVMSININQIEWFGDQRIRLANGDSSVRLLIVKESYDELKQKIKEAS